MKTFLTVDEQKDIDEVSVKIKEKIVAFIKQKYCIELTNIDFLVKQVISVVMYEMSERSNVKKGNMLKAAEKWFALSGIKTSFRGHSVYGFARSCDYYNYTIVVPKRKLVTNFKYWLITKLLK